MVVPQDQLLFTESMIMDYVTLKGIENRFGVKRQDIPISILKELIDNSLDHVETLALTPSDHDFIPEIHVQITSDSDRISLEVLNSDIKPSFTLKRIQSIFNFNNFSSTKRNQYKISRGALGNGLKAILGMSYALATENYNYDDWSPLKIRTRNRVFSIGLIVDKINGKDRPVFADIKSEKCSSDNNSIQTAVKLDIPTGGNSKTQTLGKILDTFKNYTILNPHITMNITLNGEHYSLPAVQKFKSHWNNLDSIYHYSYKEFENLVIGLRNESVTLYDFVKHIRLREASKLSKDAWNTPIIEIQHDKLLIRKLYDNLKKLANPREKLELPYDMSIKFRKKAINERLNQWGIEVKNINYKLYHENFQSADGEVEFPYLFEVAEIKTANHKHEIISGINSSPVKLESMENPDLFKWTSKGTDWTSSLIGIILEEACGYSRDHAKFKKPNTIVFIHLVSTRINWKGYGKAQIDFSPFPDLGATIYNVCKGGTIERTRNKVTQRELLTAYLIQRQTDVRKEPNVVVTDRWTPSDVWYGNRPVLQKNGIVISRNTRKNFTALIRVICEEDLHINMEELGIFAADRAQLYFDGHWYDVGIDDLFTLKLKGTDLIIIEKEGIAEVLAPYADKIGIALLFTRGFATKYVRDLVNEIEFNYLSRKRIEINSVKTKIGTEKLWEWIIYRLKDVFPNRNYNRAIEVPTVVKPDDLNELYSKIEYSIENYIESDSKKQVEELSDIVGFIDDVPQKRIDIEKRLKYLVINNSKYQDFMDKFNQLVESHPFFGREE